MKRFTAVFLSCLLTAALTSCGAKESSVPAKNSEPSSDSEPAVPDTDALPSDEPPTEAPTEAETEHVSPVETVSASMGIQQKADKVIGRKEGSNTIKFPLADYLEDGDRVSSFTFVIYSADGADIGEFKGGCGISVSGDCPAATDKYWYQSDNFTAPTQGTYGEITWNVPAELVDYISPAGEVLFGYWWGGAENIRIDSVICNIERTRDIPCDGTKPVDVGRSVNFNSADNTISIPFDFLEDGAVPQAVTFNISAGGGFGKFTGAFGIRSAAGYFQSPDVVKMTDSSGITLTWILPPAAKNYASKDGELVLGYWWSEQPEMTLDSIFVKYSYGGTDFTPIPVKPADEDKKPENTSSTGFRESAEIVKDMTVGWNLGNTLESYNTGKTGLSTETGWGNPKTTKDMVHAVKSAGFNSIRIPVTWGEHMDSDDNIQADWLARVKEVVDYAYDDGMYVILNMHHDDYIWFDPTDAEYAGDSARLKRIWEQIADYFKDYGDRLIFEGMNEARTIGSANEWMGGTAAERAVINKYQQDFVNTVRASGGNNADRSLIVTGYGASAEQVAMNDIVVPNDDHIIISLHYYAPWRFSDGQTTVFGDAEKSELDAKFAVMKQKFIDRGIPLIIDEFGCVAVADDATRAEYYRYYISSAKSQGIKCFVWDNGIAKGDSAYGIFNRTSLKWNETILDGIIGGAK